MSSSVRTIVLISNSTSSAAYADNTWKVVDDLKGCMLDKEDLRNIHKIMQNWDCMCAWNRNFKTSLQWGSLRSVEEHVRPVKDHTIRFLKIKPDIAQLAFCFQEFWLCPVLFLHQCRQGLIMVKAAFENLLRGGCYLVPPGLQHGYKKLKPRQALSC